jgi:hypothetical protein
MAAMLKVYADRLSQPSRALIIFCRHVPTSPSDLFKRVPSSYRDWSILSVGWTSSISRRLPSIWARASTAHQSSRVRTVAYSPLGSSRPLSEFPPSIKTCSMSVCHLLLSWLIDQLLFRNQPNGSSPGDCWWKIQTLRKVSIPSKKKYSPVQSLTSYYTSQQHSPSAHVHIVSIAFLSF